MALPIHIIRFLSDNSNLTKLDWHCLHNLQPLFLLFYHVWKRDLFPPQTYFFTKMLHGNFTDFYAIWNVHIIFCLVIFLEYVCTHFKKWVFNVHWPQEAYYNSKIFYIVFGVLINYMSEILIRKADL